MFEKLTPSDNTHGKVKIFEVDSTFFISFIVTGCTMLMQHLSRSSVKHAVLISIGKDSAKLCTKDADKYDRKPLQLEKD